MTDPLSTPPAELDPTPAPADPAPAPAAQTPAPAPTDPAPAEVKSTWPDDWRQSYSEDPKILKRLERYASPKAALDALFAAQNKISSGGLKTALSAEATPEEKTAWRADNGIPATAGDYDLTLPNGRVIGEADKAMVDEFLNSAHESNMHPDQVKNALGWYFDKQESAAVAQDARDTESRMKSEDALRAEFGQDYRRNVLLAKQMLESAPEGIGDQLMAGRLADGTPVGNSPEVIRWLVSLSREINPIASVMPGSGTNAMQAMDSELATLRSKMGDSKSDYWKGPASAKNQARYRELTSAKQKGR
jgi:hypothetical protein